MAGEIFDNRGRGDAGWRMPSIHPEGRRFGLVALGVALFLLLVLDWELLGWPILALAIGIFAFFRDPERVVIRDDDLILSPADGQVIQIENVAPPPELVEDDGSGASGLTGEPATRISIFMSVFDVHINRAPIGGTVRRVVYMPGRFLNAELDKASSDNERHHILIERSDGRMIGFTQIAGLVARRIVPWVKAGDMLAAGQRVGLIRFGSRVDIYLPGGTDPAVLIGQRVVAGETILARFGHQELIEGVLQ